MNQQLIETLSPYSTIILVGGGTGGHIQPIVSLTRHIKNTDKTPDFLWIGGSDSGEEKVAKEENIRFNSIPTLKLATTRSFKVLLYPLFLKLGLWKARRIISSVIATKEAIHVSENSENGSLHSSRGQTQICVFSKGGPGSVAIGIAAWSLRIPLYIHESDTIPGRSNRILAKFATKIFLGFEGAKQYFNSSKCEVIGQILDPVFLASFGKEVPDRAEDFLKLRKSPGIITETDDSLPLSKEGTEWKTSKPHILVICGSQGSRAIFNSIIDQFSGSDDYEWILALGKLNSNMQTEFDTISDCQALEWISQSDIAHLIQDTDIAISRGSATTLAELTSGDPINPHLIIVPLPCSAGNHQYYNALEYEKLGHTLLSQENLHKLIEIITKNVGHNQ